MLPSLSSEVSTVDGIIILIILFFAFNFIFKTMKNLNAKAKQTQQQTEAKQAAEAAKSAPVKPPVSKPKSDFRFPSQLAKPAPAPPAFQEGRDPGAIMREYTPISPSPTLKSQFSDYQGSLKTAVAEGIGYQSETYDAVPAPYDTDMGDAVKILPDQLTRDTLVQAVVMSEILKRPGVRR